MSCEQKSLVQRLAVEESTALEGPAWKEHLRQCAECRHEWKAFAQSLAVFRQLESERISRHTAVPGWERFSRILAHDSRWPRALRSWRIQVAAAAAGLFIVGGGSAWLAMQDTAPAPSLTAEREEPAQRQIVPRSSVVDADRLNFVSNQSGGRAMPARRPRAQAPIYLLEPGGGGGGVIVESGEQAGAAPEGRQFPLYLTPLPAEQPGKGWKPPTATRVPSEPIRMQYPVRYAPRG